MLRVQEFRCSLAKAEADALNLASGEVYTRTLVWHYRVYRRTGHWLSKSAGSRLEDLCGGLTELHAHSRDAAQQGFYEACDVARAQRKAGIDGKYPHKRKRYRTTTWKNTGIRLHDGALVLSRGRSAEPIRVNLPTPMLGLPSSAYRQIELVWHVAVRCYSWHLTVENGQSPTEAPGDGVVAVDLGEIHPAALSDGVEGSLVSCRELRSQRQYTSKRLAAIAARQAGKTKRSRRWRRLQRRRNRFQAQQARRVRDLDHKVSRAVVSWAVEHEAGSIVIGDVRDIADGKRLNRVSQQKLGLWSHGKQQTYIEYKAKALGIVMKLVDEHHTTRTCPRCTAINKPRGRTYVCSKCGFVGHRDVVGATNIWSRQMCGEPGRCSPPKTVKYLRPFVRGRRSSRLDTAQVARRLQLREAVGL